MAPFWSGRLGGAEVVLNAGEVLYVPPYHFHEVCTVGTRSAPEARTVGTLPPQRVDLDRRGGDLGDLGEQGDELEENISLSIFFDDEDSTEAEAEAETGAEAGAKACPEPCARWLAVSRNVELAISELLQAKLHEADEVAISELHAEADAETESTTAEACGVSGGVPRRKRPRPTPEAPGATASDAGIAAAPPAPVPVPTPTPLGRRLPLAVSTCCARLVQAAEALHERSGCGCGLPRPRPLLRTAKVAAWKRGEEPRLQRPEDACSAAAAAAELEGAMFPPLLRFLSSPCSLAVFIRQLPSLDCAELTT